MINKTNTSATVEYNLYLLENTLQKKVMLQATEKKRDLYSYISNRKRESHSIFI